MDGWTDRLINGLVEGWIDRMIEWSNDTIDIDGEWLID